MSIYKTCTFRTPEEDNCPYGLPITDGCESIGESIFRMRPLEEEEDEARQARLKRLNRKIFIRHSTDERCPFADQIMRGVVCRWGEKYPLIPSTNLDASAIYPSVFQGMGGLFSYPMTNLTNAYDDTYSNLPFGWFSLQGSIDENIEKRALSKRLKK